MKRHLQTTATTLIVGFGVWFGLFISSTLHGLLAETSPSLFEILSIASRVVGIIAALFWAIRRICGRPMTLPECIVIFLASISLAYMAYLYVPI